jgi:hypothetical protein
MNTEDRREQGDRGFIDWTPRADSRVMVGQILSVIQNYRDQGVPAPTVRDVMYEVRSRYGFKKTVAFKRRVYRLLSKMRRAEMIGFDEIDDDSPTMITGRGYDDPTRFWHGVRGDAIHYVRDLTQGQPYRVIVLTEGAGKVRQFRTVSGRYDIPVFSGGGWESIKLKRNLAKEAAAEYRASGRPTLALHCGDFDADGVGIFEAGIEDVRAFIAGMDVDAEPEEVLQVERLMLLYDRAAELPDEDKDFIVRSQIKAKDHRGRRWYDAMAAQGIRPFKCELEALPIPDRLAILRERIEQLVDHDRVSAVQAEADSERKEIMGKIDALEDGALVPDGGAIPADVVDAVKRDLEFEVGSRICRVTGWGPQVAPLTEELQKRIARRGLRGE